MAEEEKGASYRDVQPDYGEHKQTEVPKGEHLGPEKDALGLDKRRSVVGFTSGPSKTRRAIFYGGFLAILAAALIGFKLAADELDQPPETNPDVAPWSAEDAPSLPPKPIDQATPPGNRTG